MRDDVARALATKALEVAQKAKSQQGPKGEKGDAGQIIVQPNKGDQGDQGPMGPQGIPGKSIVGPKGDKGDRGDTGLKGDKGDQGEAGKDGAQGERGERGFTGLKGAGGSQGPIGPMPKHEKKGLMIRFEKEPGTWGEWIIMPTGGGGGGRDDKLTDRQAELVALAEFYKTRSGNANKFVKTDGTNLVWADGDGVGDVTGPASSTDNAVALFDGTTGKVLKSGGVLATVATTGEYSDLSGLPTFGTIATQDANAVAITGGTIDNTSIGATTPSTVNATTITGQTGVLRGTGQNLLTRSQLIGGTDWQSVGGATASTNAVVAPDSTTTASTLTVASGGYYRQITGVNTISAGATYTFSCYVKASASGGAANTRLTTNNVNAWNTGFSTRFALTSSWQRVSVTGTISGSSCYAIIGAIDATGTNDALCAGNVDVWGAQLELASSVGTYIPTTTTAVYGTPTLSFSGVSSIGLLSTGALYLQPAGTGALQAQATTSTTAGGNARGINAVDWQTNRGSAGNVASATNSVIGGGNFNTASGAQALVAGGSGNIASNSFSNASGGQSNTASGVYSTVNGGASNTVAGYFNYVGGGYVNSGTSGSAVTTQATTTVTSGSTAVTLSGSNASIRVGQYITGTGISAHTYVAAISGTSLTLSQNAVATGTPTLSFFRPHGVVVGGGNNQATGSYSFIGGGGDAGTAANRNVASGDWSFVGGGQTNSATANYGAVVGGNINYASGFGSFVGSGFNLNASAAASYGAILGGATHLCNSAYSAVLGGYQGTTRSIVGASIVAASQSPTGGGQGSVQQMTLHLGVQTTDATATALRSNTSAAGTTNQVILPNNSAYLFKATVISNVTGGGNTSAWKLEGAIKRGANAASTTIVGLVTTTLLAQDAGAATWAIAATADTTNGGLRITFTGQASTTIRTVCKVETTEVTF
jgi:hypothetical protein